MENEPPQDRACLNSEIDLLRRLINEAKGSPALQRSLCETLARLTVIQESREIRASRLVDIDLVMEFVSDYTDLISNVLKSVITDEALLHRIVDEVSAANAMPRLENDAKTIQRLLK